MTTARGLTEVRRVPTGTPIQPKEQPLASATQETTSIRQEDGVEIYDEKIAEARAEIEAHATNAFQSALDVKGTHPGLYTRLEVEMPRFGAGLTHEIIEASLNAFVAANDLEVRNKPKSDGRRLSKQVSIEVRKKHPLNAVVDSLNESRHIYGDTCNSDKTKNRLTDTDLDDCVYAEDRGDDNLGYEIGVADGSILATATRRYWPADAWLVAEPSFARGEEIKIPFDPSQSTSELVEHALEAARNALPSVAGRPSFKDLVREATGYAIPLPLKGGCYPWRKDLCFDNQPLYVRTAKGASRTIRLNSADHLQFKISRWDSHFPGHLTIDFDSPPTSDQLIAAAKKHTNDHLPFFRNKRIKAS